MITAAAIIGFLAGIFPGIVIGYRKGLAERREIDITCGPAKPWGGVDAEHADLTRGRP